MTGTRRAVVLVSGGMDSAVVLAIAREQGFACHALSVAYGQRHTSELDAAGLVAGSLGAVEHKTVTVDLRSIGGSALTDEAIAVPTDEDGHVIGAGIPVTYVPARNTIMLSVALGWAEVLGASDIFCGVNAVDYSGYPDCRPEFVDAFERLANLATRAGVEGAGLRVHAPLQHMGKDAIVREGTRLGVDFSVPVAGRRVRGGRGGGSDAVRGKWAVMDSNRAGTESGGCDASTSRRERRQSAGTRWDKIPGLGR